MDLEDLLPDQRSSELLIYCLICQKVSADVLIRLFGHTRILLHPTIPSKCSSLDPVYNIGRYVCLQATLGAIADEVHYILRLKESENAFSQLISFFRGEAPKIDVDLPLELKELACEVRPHS